jgi:hypothetical protein
MQVTFPQGYNAKVTEVRDTCNLFMNLAEHLAKSFTQGPCLVSIHWTAVILRMVNVHILRSLYLFQVSGTDKQITETTQNY